MVPLLIIHGSVYWIGPLDMWINLPEGQRTQPFYERASGRTCSL
ncbi:Hypothetical protein FORC64_p320 (plasmid) [Escherichia coli]|nr:Hypothetical protein FORC64_p320 [Escherichia coli]EII76113.1 hypothetical protein EC32303_A0103 [Escherichia coli 3.2303]